MVLDRPVATLLERGEVGGRGAEDGDAVALREVPEDAGRLEGRAVEEDRRGTRDETGDEVIPHHPARRGEEERHVVRRHVAVDDVLFGELEQHAAGAVRDRFRLAGRPAGEEDPERVVKVELRELDLLCRLCGINEGRPRRPAFLRRDV